MSELQSGALVQLYPNFAWALWNTWREASDRAAIVHRGVATSYGALRARASAFGAVLERQGIRPGQRVGILLERDRDAAAAFFGALSAGAVAIHINETLRPRQIEHILGHAGVSALITSDDLLGRLPRPLHTGETSVISASGVPDDAEERTPTERIASDPAQIIYTSGSTGLPKGVTLSHENLWAGMQAVVAYLGITREDRIASLLPFSFDYGLNQLFCAVGTGAALVVERSPLPHRVAAMLREEEVTVLGCVPPLWLQLLETPSFRSQPLPKLRLMTNTGGQLPIPTVRALRAAQPQAKLFLMYGLTEAFRSAYLPPDEVDQRPDSFGRAIPGAQLLVLNDAGEECRPGEVGELVHRGPTVALGYWNDPDATAGVYRPNPLRPPGAPAAERVVFSGDLVKRDADGFLYYVARKDRVIKTLGYRVSPDEVMSALYASGQVVEALVTGEPDAHRGQRILAHVVLKPEGSLERLEEFARIELPRYMQPAEYRVHAELPRTSSGKHDPRALEAPATGE